MKLTEVETPALLVNLPAMDANIEALSSYLPPMPLASG